MRFYMYVAGLLVGLPLGALSGVIAYWYVNNQRVREQNSSDAQQS